ncbi:hypothetical protein IWQ60_002819 [Tieghemiomyces parasiticus]|uniref:Uncharacterized protein n=1 Tax=Tieghemiomyces parasiticus TaxID=78921 RepID=A0A9W8E1A0_9FUNG|nr:hypothetical protein IWQ60_002819 [Tieghemiomyces parasiticus]
MAHSAPITAKVQSTDKLLETLEWWRTQGDAWHALHGESQVQLRSAGNIRSQRAHAQTCRYIAQQGQVAPGLLGRQKLSAADLATLLARQTTEIIRALDRLRALHLRMLANVQVMDENLRQLRNHYTAEGTDLNGQAAAHSTVITQFTVGPAVVGPARVLAILEHLADMYRAESEVQRNLLDQLSNAVLADDGEHHSNDQGFDELTTRWVNQCCVETVPEQELRDIIQTIKQLRRQAASV